MARTAYITVNLTDPPESTVNLVGLGTGSGSGGDKNYVTSFTNLSQITVNHGLNKKCSVTFIDTAGTKVTPTVIYTPGNDNQIVVQFSEPTSGTITCN
jgi:hypothetical protein